MDMEQIDRQYAEYITPRAPFGWEIRTTQAMQMSNGVAWTADLLNPVGEVVGYVEQQGNGGSDRVDFYHKHDRKTWEHDVRASYDGNFDEEAATGWLVDREDKSHG